MVSPMPMVKGYNHFTICNWYIIFVPMRHRSMVEFVVEKRICNYKDFLYVWACLEYRFDYFEKGPNFPRTF